MLQLDVRRTSFRQFNRLMILYWRLGFGYWFDKFPSTMGRIMVLTTTGRRSGRPRRTPLNFARVGNAVYCMAGFGEGADWFRNARATPEVEVWLPGERWSGRAEVVEEPAARAPILRQILINSGFAASAFEGIDPHAISDESLARRMADRPLVRIVLEKRYYGPGGPADLLWVWALLALALLAVVYRWRREARDW